MKMKYKNILNCHFHTPEKCRILKEMLCTSGKCSFCKTTEQYLSDLEKYPSCNYEEIYAARHKNDMK